MSLVFEQYTDRLRRKRRSPHSLSAFATASTRLDRWLAAQGLTAETASYVVLEDYFDGLATELKPSTAETHLKYVRAAYNYAILRGTIRANPVLDLEIAKGPDVEPKIVPNECLRTIRERVQFQRDWIFFHLLAYTGMRRAEIVGLRWEENVALDEQTIRVVGKGGKLRLIPIHPALGEVLTECPHQGPFVLRSTGKRGVASETIQDMTKRLFVPRSTRRTTTGGRWPRASARNGVQENIHRPDHGLVGADSARPLLRERRGRGAAPRDPEAVRG
jgi:site-specific recombinase XerD